MAAITDHQLPTRKHPEAFEITMTPTMHTFSEMALCTGRFEMEAIPGDGVRRQRSAIDVDRAEALGLFTATKIYACYPEDEQLSMSQLADKLGRRCREGWELSPPESTVDRSLWDKLLLTDQVLIFEAPTSREWLEVLTSQLFRPFVAEVPSISHFRQWVEFEKASFKSANDLLHVSFGIGRSLCTFVGTGEIFNTAVAAASLRPPMLRGYPGPAFKDIARSRKNIFGASPKKGAQKPEELKASDGAPSISD